MSPDDTIKKPDDELECDLKLKHEARKEVSRPRAAVHHDLPVEELRGKTLIVVGDVVAKTALEVGLEPVVCIIDLKVRRQRFEPPLRLEEYEVMRTSNPPGIITREAWSTVRTAMETAKSGCKIAVIVEGEEDLLGFPAAYFAPDGAVLLYGQPMEGVVTVTMCEEERNRVKRMLDELFTCTEPE